MEITDQKTEELEIKANHPSSRAGLATGREVI
jgi:hypothetical protein